MSIETSNENVCINRLVMNKEENFVVETDEIVPDIKPDILNIIAVDSNVCVTKKEIMERKVKVEGVVHAYISYLADDEMGNVRCIHSEISFIEMIDCENMNDTMDLVTNVEIKSINVKILNGRKINIQIELCANLQVYSNENIQMIRELKDIDDLQRLNQTYQVNSLVGKGNTFSYANEIIKLEKTDNLLDIMNVKINMINPETKISYHKVLAKADAQIKIVYITDDNRINTASAIIPMMSFIEIPDITEECQCDITYQLKNMNVQPNAAEEHSINVDLEFSVNCFASQERNIELIQDFYSPSKELEYSQETMQLLRDKNQLRDIYHFQKQEVIQELSNRKIYDVKVSPSITKQQILNGRVLYEGDLELTFFFATTEEGNGINSSKIREPFQFQMATEQIKENSNIQTAIEVISQDFIVMPDESINTKIDLEFQLDLWNTEEIRLISEVREIPEKRREKHSIIVYYTKPGDSLWSIAKRFGSTIEAILQVNQIENENMIFSGEQIFIPR